MTFTIGKDLIIKGTRGELGSIHITFDTDLTGTQGVFLVKRTPCDKDCEAFLVKPFVFGSNPAISGKEVILSFSREDTEHMPLFLPHSEFTFESDYKCIEFTDYVWTIQLCSDGYTETVIPYAGTKYPTFRLYNEAYHNRHGRPIIPTHGPGAHINDIYATKKDLLNYAAYEKHVTDQLRNASNANADEISRVMTESGANLSALSAGVADRLVSIEQAIASGQSGSSVLIYQVVDSLRQELKPDLLDVKEAVRDAESAIRSVNSRVDTIESQHVDIAAVKTSVAALQTGMTAINTVVAKLGTDVATFDERLDGVEENVIDAKRIAVEAQQKVLDTASSIARQYSDFVDEYVVDGTRVSGVDAERVFVEDYWRTPDVPVGQGLPVLGAGATPVVGTDVVSVETAIRRLYDGIQTLDGQVSDGNAALSDRIDAVSSIVSANHEDSLSRIGVLSDSLRALATELSDGDMVLSGRIDILDAGLSDLINVVEASHGNLSGAIGELSGIVDAKNAEIIDRLVNLVLHSNSRDDELSGRIDAIEADVESKTEALSGDISALSELTDASLADIRGRIDDVISGSESGIGELSSSVGIAIEILGNRIDSATGDIETQITGIVSDFTASLETERNNMLAALSGVAEEASSAAQQLQQGIETLADDFATSAQNLSSAIDEVNSSLSLQISELSGNAANADIALNGRITNLQATHGSDMSAMSSRIDGVVTAMDAADVALGTLIGNLTATVEVLRNDVTSADAALDAGKIDKSSIAVVLDGGSTNETVPGTHAVYEFVNSSINSLAAFYLTKDAAGNAFATKAELDAAIGGGTFYNGGVARTPTKNDYCVVLADETRTGADGDPTTRYVFDGNVWAFQYVVNNKPLTQAQVNAMNSGITAEGLATITGNIAGLSSTVGELSGGVVAQLTSINSSIAALRNDTESGINRLGTDVSGLSGVVGTLSGGTVAEFADVRTAISGVVTSFEASLSADKSEVLSAISGVSEAASAGIGEVASGLGTVSGNVGTLSGSLGTVSGNVNTLSGNLGALSGVVSGQSATISEHATELAGHESRIESLEHSQFFNSVADAQAWCKTFIPNLVFTNGGTAAQTSTYTDKEVLKLILGIVTKLASAADNRYFDSEVQARGWVKDNYVPGIAYTAGGELDENNSVFTDEDVLDLVLGIVGKMAQA